MKKITKIFILHRVEHNVLSFWNLSLTLLALLAGCLCFLSSFAMMTKTPKREVFSPWPPITQRAREK